MKRFNTDEIWKHLKSTLEVAISSLLMNEYVIRVTDGSLTDDVTGDSHMFSIRLTVHVEKRTQPLVVPAETHPKS